MPEGPRRVFADLLSRPEVEMDRAALLIAAEEYPGLPLERYLKALDAFAARVRHLLYADAGPREIFARLNQVLFEEAGFRGNTESYYDPRNSYLNEVIDRRTGIPITVSLVYMEVARRVGFMLDGVAFPGHFLVKHEAVHGTILIDPFDRGRFLTDADCRARLEKLFGGELELAPNHLEAASPRQILTRMLHNLKDIYLGLKEDRRALAAIERILLLNPDSPSEVRDRGMLLVRLKRPVEALAELGRYRRLAPMAPDEKRIEALMDSLRMNVGFSN